MTQKELLYVEDAIKHETNMIAVLEDTMNKLSDKSLRAFLKGETKKHQSMKARLLKCLEVLIND